VHLCGGSGFRLGWLLLVHLCYRLRNLLDRDLVVRSGQKYSVTDAGLAWQPLREAIGG